MAEATVARITQVESTPHSDQSDASQSQRTEMSKNEIQIWRLKIYLEAEVKDLDNDCGLLLDSQFAVWGLAW